MSPSDVSASGPTPPGFRPTEPGISRPEAPRSADILSFPPGLEDDRSRVRHLHGDVTRRTRDGEVRIRTDRGELRVRIDPCAPSPQEGQKVDIDIPPSGNAPPKAYIRPAGLPPRPVEDAGPVPLPPPVSGRTQSGKTESAPPRMPYDFPSGTPSSAPAEPLAPQGFVPLPPEETPLRFVFLPPAQLSTLKPIETDVLQTKLAPFVAGLSLDHSFFPHNESVTNLVQPSGANPALTLPADILSADILSLRASTVLPGGLKSALTLSLVRPETLSKNPSALPKTWDLSSLLKATGASFADFEQTQASLSTTGLRENVFQDGLMSLHLFARQSQISEAMVGPFSHAIPLQANGTLSIELFDAGAQEVPERLDLRILSVSAKTVHIGAAQAESSTPHLKGALRAAPNTPIGILDGTAGFLMGQTLALSTPDDRPVVLFFLPDSRLGHFFTPSSGLPNVPVGSFFEAMAAPLSTLPSALSATAASGIYPNRPDVVWPAMDEVLQTLGTLSPALAQSLAHTLPTPSQPASIGPTILFFAAALRAGDMSGWIGEKAVDALRKAGKTETLNRLGRDFAGLSEIAAREADDAGWRAMSVPFLWENRIHRAALHYRSADDDDTQDGKQSGGKSTRFVFDLSFKRMGEVQLDGLYRDRRLDVALRTVAPLSQTMRQTLRSRFADGLAHSGIAGEIHFQNDKNVFVKIPTRDKPRSAWV